MHAQTGLFSRRAFTGKQTKGAAKLSRRSFLGSALTAGAAFSIVPRHVVARSGQLAPSEKLNLGCVGVGGMMGAGDVNGVSSENIYAICDVDENFLNKSAEKYPQAKKYRDFREMLDKEYKNLDGITVTIPDHMHATVALWAMERGLHVHCQKPPRRLRSIRLRHSPDVKTAPHSLALQIRA